MTKSMNCSPIHSANIPLVLENLNRNLGIDFSDRLLGSAGKKDMSGDIDIAVTPEEFEHICKRIIEDIQMPNALVANVLSSAWPYTPENSITHHVQVDFMKCENIEAAKLFYHAPKHSRYSGEMRTILAMIVFGCIQKTFQEHDNGVLVRYMSLSFSPKYGLVAIKRELQPRKDGKGYTKKWVNTPFLRDRPLSAERILVEYGIDVDSFESIFWSVRNRYSPRIPEIIRKFRERKETQHISPIEFKWYEDLYGAL